MRSLLAVISVLLLSVLASAQATIISGYASNWSPSYGVYAAPFVPLVSTPSATLGSGFQAQVGASNATAGNIAGATNATMSITSPTLTQTQTIWPTLTPPRASSEAASPENEATRNSPIGPARITLGVASFQDNVGLAQLAAAAKPGQMARVYTNQDVEQMNQSNGEVRYGGKTERIE
jgi:hypothetical protein